MRRRLAMTMLAPAMLLAGCAQPSASTSGPAAAPVFSVQPAAPTPQVTLPATLDDLRTRAVEFARAALPSAGLTVPAALAADPAPTAAPVPPTPSASPSSTRRPAKPKPGKPKPSKPKPGKPAKPTAAAPAKPSTVATTPPVDPAAGQPQPGVVSLLAGPAMLFGLGKELTPAYLAGGLLPATFATWRGCPACDPVALPRAVERFAGDLADPASQLGVVRQTGSNGGTLDPRGTTLGALPALVVFAQDTSHERWRTWYLVFDANGERIMALVGETGRL